MRTTSRNTIVAVVAVAAVFAAMTACTKQDSPPESLAHAGQDWPTIGGGMGNTHFSTLDQISATNIKNLGAAWVQDLGDPIRGTVVVAGGKMYAATAKKALALDPKTGATIWSRDLPFQTYGLFKGVSLGEGLVFVGLGNSHIVALRQDTGEQVWQAIVGDGDLTSEPVRGQFIAGGPNYANGVVVSGLANADYGIQGRVVAFDAKTGERLWRFNSTPMTQSEPGAETWSWSEGETKIGGGGVWSIPVIDPDLGMVYFGVGNPIPGYSGELRPGDNLFSNALVALDLKTGAVKWHYQITRHDIWEADLGTPIILYDAMVNGKTRKAVAAASTYGHIFMFDRETGEPIFPIEDRPVPQSKLQATAATQPFPVGADMIGPACVDPETVPKGWLTLCVYDPIDHTMPNAMYPLKSLRAAPMAYSPVTKTFYATGADWPSWLLRFEDPQVFVAGPTAPGMKYKGIVAAMDAQTNKLKWRHFEPYAVHENGSGFLATSSGLLFRGSTDGNLYAYSQEKGEQLWKFQTGASANNAVATYEVDGEQTVVVVSASKLWAFRLGGTVPPSETAPPPTPTETTFRGRIEDVNEVVMGATIADTGLEKTRYVQDEYAYRPVRVRVKVGDTLTWKNEGKKTHDATDKGGAWTTGPVEPGASAKVTFDKAGTYQYTDTLHPWVFGQIVVE